MKYTTRENVTYKGKPKKWLESDKETIADIINDYYCTYIHVWDCDNCGNDNYIFAFEDGTVLKYNHYYEWSFTEDDDFDHVKIIGRLLQKAKKSIILLSMIT